MWIFIKYGIAKGKDFIMNRRNFLKLIGIAVAAPVAAIGCDPVVALGKGVIPHEKLLECRKVMGCGQDIPQWLSPELEQTVRDTIHANYDYWAKKYYETALEDSPFKGVN